MAKLTHPIVIHLNDILPQEENSFQDWRHPYTVGKVILISGSIPTKLIYMGMSQYCKLHYSDYSIKSQMLQIL